MEKQEEKVIRIISARAAESHERRGYKGSSQSSRNEDIRVIAANRDEDIDFSDVAPVLDWSRAEIGKFYRPRKKPVSIRRIRPFFGQICSDPSDAALLDRLCLNARLADRINRKHLPVILVNMEPVVSGDHPIFLRTMSRGRVNATSAISDALPSLNWSKLHAVRWSLYSRYKKNLTLQLGTTFGVCFGQTLGTNEIGEGVEAGEIPEIATVHAIFTHIAENLVGYERRRGEYPTLSATLRNYKTILAGPQGSPKSGHVGSAENRP